MHIECCCDASTVAVMKRCSGSEEFCPCNVALLGVPCLYGDALSGLRQYGVTPLSDFNTPILLGSAQRCRTNWLPNCNTCLGLAFPYLPVACIMHETWSGEDCRGKITAIISKI